MPKVTVMYFAVLREASGVTEESVDTAATTADALYDELRERHGFGLAPERMKLVINDEFVDWSAPLNDGDAVAFIPPVAGG